MPDPATPAAPPATPAAAPPVDPGAPPAVSADPWLAAPEVIRNDQGIRGKYKTPDDAYKGLAEAYHMVGKKTDGMVRIPGANATPEERSAFNKALGVPATADEYKFEVAEDFKAVLTDEALGRYRPIFHKLGIPNETAGKLAQAYAEDQIQQRIALQQGFKADQEKVRDEIGQATWDRNVAHAEAGVKYIAAKLGEEKGKEFTALLDSTLLGDHPLIIEAFTLIGRELAEDGHIQVEGAGGGMLDTAKQYILDSFKPDHPAMKADHPEHAQALAQRREYYKLVDTYEPNWRAFKHE